MNLQALKEKFNQVFATDHTPRVFAAPGRVNLIGEHTDYNGGHVFPCALSFNTYALATRRNDGKIRLFSTDFEHKGIVQADLHHIAYDKQQNWANYPLGVLWVLLKREYPITNGFDILFCGDVPRGAGLSSSASIELATAVALNALFDLRIPHFELSKIGQEAENKFVGMNCGIMDQFASAMGKENHAILLDCNTLNYRYAPLDLDGICILLCNTNKPHNLIESKYNERRSQCEHALSQLQEHLPIKALGELSEETFEKYKEFITDPIERKRAKHAVYENQRALLAVQKLQEADLQSFGKLMNASHISLRDDYEVTGPELDAMAAAAWEQPGVLGARMTGGGFGGCVVALVKTENVDTFKNNVARIYQAKTGYKPDFYIAAAGAGAREIK
ncbi:MAG: galactokinase [Elusimicrobiaceae bacterium]|nr:galactokinase [Elusimicrobiaceae bacterium]